MPWIIAGGAILGSVVNSQSGSGSNASGQGYVPGGSWNGGQAYLPPGYSQAANGLSSQ